MAKKHKNRAEINYQWGDECNLSLYHDDIFGFKIDANKNMITQLINRFDLADIAYLHFDAQITRQQGKHIHSKGNQYVIDLLIKGDMTQFCVVSGDKIPEHIDDMVKIRVLPISQHDDSHADNYDIDEDIEYHDNHIIDMTELLIQNFAILLSPFPRIDGDDNTDDMVYSDEDKFQQQANDDKSNNPFAVLEKLKK